MCIGRVSSVPIGIPKLYGRNGKAREPLLPIFSSLFTLHRVSPVKIVPTIANTLTGSVDLSVRARIQPGLYQVDNNHLHKGCELPPCCNG
jgi:hypothetical protein